MCHVDVVQRQPQKTRRDLCHEPARDEDRQLVRAGKLSRVSRKVVK